MSARDLSREAREDSRGTTISEMREDHGNLMLLEGQIAGILMATLDGAAAIKPSRVQVEVDSEGNYTNRIIIVRASGKYVLTVTKEDD